MLPICHNLGPCLFPADSSHLEYLSPTVPLTVRIHLPNYYPFLEFNTNPLSSSKKPAPRITPQRSRHACLYLLQHFDLLFQLLHLHCPAPRFLVLLFQPAVECVPKTNSWTLFLSWNATECVALSQTYGRCPVNSITGWIY